MYYKEKFSTRALFLFICLLPFTAVCFGQSSSLRPDDSQPTALIDGLTWELSGSSSTGYYAKLISISKELEGTLTIPESIKATYSNGIRTLEVSGKFSDGVFKDLKNITEINLPKNFYSSATQSLKGKHLNEVFEGCNKLESLTINSSNTKTVNGVLYSLQNAYTNKAYVYWYTLEFYPPGKKDVEFTPDCLYIGSSGSVQTTDISLTNFAYNPYLKVFNIPKGYSVSGNYVNTPSLETFNVSASNGNYSSEDGILMNKDKTELICYPPAKQTETYIIPSNITKLGYYSFTGNNPKTIYVKENVTSFYSPFSYYTGKVVIDFIPEGNLLNDLGNVNKDCTFLLHGQCVKDLPDNFAGKIETFEDVYIQDMVSDYFNVKFKLGGANDIENVSADGVECIKDETGYYVADHLLPNSTYTVKIVYNINGIKKEQEYEINTAKITTTWKDSPSLYLGKIIFSLEMNSSDWNQSKNPNYFTIYCEETQKTYSSNSSGCFSIDGLAPAKKYTFKDVKGHWGDRIADVPYNGELIYNTKTPEVSITTSTSDTSIKINSISFNDDKTWEPSLITVSVNEDYKTEFILENNEWKNKAIKIDKLIPETSYRITAHFYTGEEIYSNSKWLSTSEIPLNIVKNIGPTSIHIVANKDESSDANVSKIYFDNQDSNTYGAIGLKPNTKHTVNLNIDITEGKTYKRQLELITPSIEWSEIETEGLTSSTSRILVSTNISEYETGAGFQWKKNDAPESLKPSEGFAAVYGGKLSGVLKNLQSTSYYIVRAFYKDADGIYYTSEWTVFDPSDFSYFEPDVHTYPANYISCNEATVRGYVLQGSEDIEEQGFEYWSTGNSGTKKIRKIDSNVNTVLSTGQMMSALLTDLEENTEYIYRSFATCAGKTTYGEEMSFTTESSLAGIETISNDINYSEVIAYYGLDGKRYSVPQRGFNIVVYSDGRTKKLIIR